MSLHHKVADGDCMSSIAIENGFYWETLWNLGENSDLKNKRKDPNILMQGDDVFVPDLTLKEVSAASDASHKFKVKGVPAKLRLRLLQEKKPDPGKKSSSNTDQSQYVAPTRDPLPEMEPRANVPYSLEIDGTIVKEGNTDGDGRIEIPIPPNADKGLLYLNRGTDEQEVIPLDLGHMDPIDELTGVRKRLANLHYGCLPDGPTMTDDLKAALHSFQERNGLHVSGDIDQATKDKLKSIHGS